MRNRLPALAVAVLGILLSASIAVAGPAGEATLVEGGGFPDDISGNGRSERAYGVEFTTEIYAYEMDYGGESTFYTVLTNTGTETDVITVDITQDELPDGVGSFDWFANYCDTNGTCHFGPWDYTLAPGQAETFDVHVIDNLGTAEGMALTTLHATSNGDTLVAITESYGTFIEVPSVLIVDDDGGAGDETYIETAVADAGFSGRRYDPETELDGYPTLDMLDSHRVVLWTTGSGDASGITSTVEDSWMDYLNGGGSLFLASSAYLSSRPGATTFTTDYLHLTTWNDDVGGALVTGVPGNGVTDDMTLPLTTAVASSDDGMGNPDFPDDSFFTLFDSAEGAKGIGGGEDGHILSFLSFAFENISTAAPDPNNQKTLVGRIITWSDAIATGVEDGEVEVARVSLGQNFPNPFNPVTTIEYAVPADAGRVSLTVHNVNGQVVRTLVDGRVSPGSHTVAWDGTDDAGKSVSSGIYFSRLTAADDTAFMKMTLLK